MNKQKYLNQVDKLIAIYGTKNYSKQVIDMIWKEVNTLSDEWLAETVDMFVGMFKFAPVVFEFRDAAITERDRLTNEDKKRRRKEADQFWKTSYTDEDTQGMFETIRGRIKKENPTEEDDANWKNFLELVKGVARHTSKYTCQACDDAGVRIVNHHAYKCTCTRGLSDWRKYPRYA